MRWLDDDEGSERARKLALKTEDAGIRTAEQVEHLDVFSRILLPYDWEKLRGREIDIIGVSDIGVVVIEIKRESGRLSKQRGRKKYRIHSGHRTKLRMNPFTDIKEKAALIQGYLEMEPDLAGLCKEWKSKGQEHFPVYSVICFGPTSDIVDIKESDPDVLVCVTRTLKRALSKLIREKPTVKGTRLRLAHGFASYCRFQGILTGDRAFGEFERARLKNVMGVPRFNFDGVVWASRKARGLLRIRFADGKSMSLIADDVNFSSGPNLFTFGKSETFTWRAGSKKRG